MGNYRKTNSGNFSRTKAAGRYYSYGSYAARVEDARDRVSLKYYGRQVKKQEQLSRISSVKKICTFSFICFCCIISVFAKSAATNYKIANNRLKSELEEKRYKTESLIMRNKETIDLAYVEEIATTRLNMSRPQPYQKVYIDVPKTDYTVVYSSYKPEEEEELDIIEFLKTVFINK